jgi:hypothetical protein
VVKKSSNVLPLTDNFNAHYEKVNRNIDIPLSWNTYRFGTE